MPNPTHDEDEQPKKRFRIQRKRLGTIKFVREDGEFGFIEAEDFRDDVFFHRTVWDPNDSAEASPDDNKKVVTRSPRDCPSLSQTLVDAHVEFEIDDEVFSEEKKLRAKIVRPTKRPGGKKLSGRDATFRIVTHHPRARRKRPTWRDKSE